MLIETAFDTQIRHFDQLKPFLPIVRIEMLLQPSILARITYGAPHVVTEL